MRLSPIRLVLIVLGAIMLLAAAWLHSMSRDPQAVGALVIYGVLLTAGVAFERWRYRPDVNPRLPGWEPTEERFVDPATGQLTRVWYNPATGQRDYRAE